MRVSRTLFRSIKKADAPAPKWKGARPAAIFMCIYAFVSSVKKRQNGSFLFLEGRRPTHGEFLPI
jgi:hypothetical protein